MLANILLLRPAPRSTQGRIFAMEQLGLSYIAAYARQAGLSVRILDGFLEPEEYEKLLNSISEGEYQLIGYPVYQESVNRIARDVERIRSRGVRTHVTVGNYLATLASEEVLAQYSGFDSAVRGEGEITCYELASCLLQGNDLSLVSGLTYRKGDKIICNPPRTNHTDLDSLPFPARDTLPLVIAAGNAPLLYSSRGCNARCDFCSVHVFYNSSPNGAWRARTAVNVVDEMESLEAQFGVTEFAFADEQFMGHGRIGRSRAIAIAEEIIRRNKRFKWYIETRSSEVSYETFQILAAGGLKAVYMGLESGSETALREMRKGLHPSQHLCAVEVLKSLEIIVSVGFIMFRPTTTLEELNENLDFWETLGVGEIVHLASFTKIYFGAPIQIRLKPRESDLGRQLADWAFTDNRVQECFLVMKEATSSLSVAFNHYAEIRRTGLLTYSECSLLQRRVNDLFIQVMRRLVAAVGERDTLSTGEREAFTAQFVEACSKSIAIIELVRAMSESRTIADGVRLLNPMALC